MASLLTSCITSNTIPVNYIYPEGKRAGPAKKADLPVINLQDKVNLTSQIMKASQEEGIFLVINHGIPTEQMNRTMKIFKDFFDMPPEERGKFPLDSDVNKVCRLYTSSYNYDDEELHFWREVFRAECSHMDECMKFLPQKPENFKEVIGGYVTAVEELRLEILEHLSQGLGLERGYLGGLSENASLTVNRYPPCPDPSLTMGLHEHTDATVITILQSGNVPGFQFVKDGQWFRVETPPEAFLVLMGSQIEVISNGVLKGLQHRVISTTEERYSIAFNIQPLAECLVEPAKATLEAGKNPSLYQSFRYKDFFKAFVSPKLQGKAYEDVVRELSSKS